MLSAPLLRAQGCQVRFFGGSRELMARNVVLGQDQVRAKVAGKTKTQPSRQERIDRANMRTWSKLEELDGEYGVFSGRVRRVLDLGFVPGNWSEFARQRLCQIHGVAEEKFHEQCHILGVDILFGTPPAGVSAMQGNIFSKGTHELAAAHFKELALRRAVEGAKPKAADDSYYSKEQNESLIDQQVSEIAGDLDRLAVSPATALDYKPDLILSDLSAPFMQQKGFFNNTNTRPYLRTGANPILRRPFSDDDKVSIDLADAALVLACDLLRKGGNMVLRLAKVKLDDPELDLLETRLDRVFVNVHKWNRRGLYDTESAPPDDLFYVCMDKRDDVANKKAVFKI